MILSNIHCSEYERKALVMMLQGKKKKDDEEDFVKVLGREIERRSNGEQSNADR